MTSGYWRERVERGGEAAPLHPFFYFHSAVIPTFRFAF
jgi:hypothetical protein